MTKTVRRTINIILGLLILSTGCNVPKKKLPYLGNPDVVYTKKNGVFYADTLYPKIPNFSFLNQDSTKVNRNTYKGKIWVVEFFFTQCPTICPIMNKQMKRVYQTIQKNNSDIEDKFQFLSFSIDPENDSPSELKKYKTAHKLQYSNWDFLTGDEASTHQLGIQNFLTFAGKDEASAGGYAHSGSFTLVDSKGFVRGVYAVTNFDLSVNEQEFNRMVNEINILLDE
ncbi:MAG: SCO family protein [Flavobacteriia bacterium]|jgi:protein SCO1/2|nr:SCO family protein [Flavobacteriia bacterium]NBY41353.1 SCO family protein [Flavobacteriia bacterium]